MAKRILIVEDSPDILELTRELLKSRGFEVMTQSNEKDLFPTIEKFNPDVIILDLYLTEKTGLDICQELKSRPSTQHLPVIITTGDFPPESNPSQKTTIGQPDAYLLKPFDLEDLLKVIKQF